MLYELKQDVEIERAYSLDGKITCVKKMADSEEKRFRINSPDDLFTTGWSEEKVKGLGIYINYQSSAQNLLICIYIYIQNVVLYMLYVSSHYHPSLHSTYKCFTYDAPHVCTTATGDF